MVADDSHQKFSKCFWLAYLGYSVASYPLELCFTLETRSVGMSFLPKLTRRLIHVLCWSNVMSCHQSSRRQDTRRRTSWRNCSPLPHLSTVQYAFEEETGVFFKYLRSNLFSMVVSWVDLYVRSRFLGIDLQRTRLSCDWMRFFIQLLQDGNYFVSCSGYPLVRT